MTSLLHPAMSAMLSKLKKPDAYYNPFNQVIDYTLLTPTRVSIFSWLCIAHVSRLLPINDAIDWTEDYTRILVTSPFTFQSGFICLNRATWLVDFLPIWIDQLQTMDIFYSPAITTFITKMVSISLL